MESNFSWIGFMMELADKLRDYKDDHKAMIDKMTRAFENHNIKLPTLEADKKPPYDMDPFSVIALLNRQVTDETRCAIATGYKEEFGLLREVPKDYDGVPQMMNIKAIFYSFKPLRGDHDIDNLWELFCCALDYADMPTEENREVFIKFFDTCRTQSSVKWNITVALYWMRPNFYLNLDSRNRWFISEKEESFKEIGAKLADMKTLPSGDEYLNLTEKVKDFIKDTEYRDLPHLSYSSYVVSQSVNKIMKMKADAEKKEIAGTGDLIGIGRAYWIYSPGSLASLWDKCQSESVMLIGHGDVGDPIDYGTKESVRTKLQELSGDNGSHNNQMLQLWQFWHEMKEGDIVYAKKGQKTIIGRGVVEGECVYDENEESEYRYSRTINWTHVGEWDHPGNAVTKILTNITNYSGYCKNLENLFDDGEGGDSPEIKYDKYREEDFLNQVYMTSEKYHDICTVLERKKNIILQGPPGVGKTFAAKRLAYSILGERNTERVMMVQFHQSYSYEDFVLGYKPSENGFELQNGPFYDFCKKAEEDGDNRYFFIIDEINRGNISKIFGELFMLIEADKRGQKIRLLYSDEVFSIPRNVYIIGMMNTADRSLAMLDYALRRRFSFISLEPAFLSYGFKQYEESKDDKKFDNLIAEVIRLNEEIRNDSTLGKGFEIGHSFFISEEKGDEWLSSIVRYELIPLLEEYWYDDEQSLATWKKKLLGAIE